MTWTAPRTWSTSEVVTASMMNIHVRDNLKFLKGQSGDIYLEDDVGVGTSTPVANINAAATRALTVSSIGSGESGGLFMEGNRTTDAAVGQIGFLNVAATGTDKRIALIISNRENSNDSGNLRFFTRNAGTLGEAVRIDRAGNVGIGTTAPQGLLHAFDTESGIFLWRNTAVAGSTVQVLAAGSVVAGLSGHYVVYDGSNRSSGAIPNVAATGTLAVTHTLHTGTGTYVLHLNANGSVDVQRTSGTGTGQISLWLLYH